MGAGSAASRVSCGAIVRTRLFKKLVHELVKERLRVTFCVREEVCDHGHGIASKAQALRCRNEELSSGKSGQFTFTFGPIQKILPSLRQHNVTLGAQMLRPRKALEVCLKQMIDSFRLIELLTPVHSRTYQSGTRLILEGLGDVPLHPGRSLGRSEGWATTPFHGFIRASLGSCLSAAPVACAALWWACQVRKQAFPPFVLIALPGF